jgi:hypothetical protein
MDGVVGAGPDRQGVDEGGDDPHDVEEQQDQYRARRTQPAACVLASGWVVHRWRKKEIVLPFPPNQGATKSSLAALLLLLLLTYLYTSDLSPTYRPHAVSNVIATRPYHYHLSTYLPTTSKSCCSARCGGWLVGES